MNNLEKFLYSRGTTLIALIAIVSFLILAIGG